jgi:hydrogenase maturation protein HypF
VTENPFPASLSSGLPSVGVMLPYTPFHHMLFDAIQTNVLVMTSGNFSNEPIIISNEDALEKFSGITDAVLVHNRPIFNRTDDSVVRIISGKERLMRRSRGYVPAALHTQLNTDGIIAMGGDLVNCFAVGRDQRVILSQYIGDLESAETHHFFEETLERFLELFRVNPVLVAGDLHPGYFSSAFGKKFRNLPFTGIQHHHAHAAACMAEHGLDEKVIAVIFDGTGWGPDNTLWGSEFLVCDLAEYRRITHFENVPLPGGDIGAEEPWRMAVSYLDHYFGNDMLKTGIPLTERIAAEKLKTVLQMIDRGINTPLTCGAGRLFDAVSSILGLNDVATFPAEGPMRLEAAAMPGVSESYEWSFNGTISFRPAFNGIMEDMHKGKEVGYIASKFHNTLVNVIFDMVKRISEAEGIQRVVLSGGVFQNRYLLTRTEEILAQNHFEVFSPAVFPANDGGIALGQLVIAAKRRDL